MTHRDAELGPESSEAMVEGRGFDQLQQDPRGSG